MASPLAARVLAAYRRTAVERGRGHAPLRCGRPGRRPRHPPRGGRRGHDQVTDTHAIARRLTDSGLPSKHAAATTDALRETAERAASAARRQSAPEAGLVPADLAAPARRDLRCPNGPRPSSARPWPTRRRSVRPRGAPSPDAQRRLTSQRDPSDRMPTLRPEDSRWRNLSNSRARRPLSPDRWAQRAASGG